jgi:hypothetical protein
MEKSMFSHWMREFIQSEWPSKGGGYQILRSKIPVLRSAATEGGQDPEKTQAPIPRGDAE